MKRSKITWKALRCWLFIYLVSHLIIGSAGETGSLKRFSGLHLFNNTIQKVYYHDLTIAVVEIGQNNTLMNCELLHVSNDQEQSEALHHLAVQICKPIAVTINAMIWQISECNKLNQNTIIKKIAETSHKSSSLLSGPRSFWCSLFNGIYPGTKWCGVGNIAKSYYDLGSKEPMDKCCRAHDFCPVQVVSGNPRYDLTPGLWFTRSHCICEDELMQCLRNVDNSFALFLAIIYFDVLAIPCINEDKDGKKRFRSRDEWF